MITRQILVVSSDSNICQYIKASMQDHSTEICCTASASEALDNFNKHNYCLVILDNQLPGINSMEMLQIIHRTKYIPILLFSDPLFPDDKVALFQAGANAIIENPFNVDICAAQAEALIRLYFAADTAHKQNDQIAFGSELTIMPCYRKVLIDGKPVLLTRKEFELLHYFARHPYQVFSREKLYSDIWGDSFAAASDETVRVHVQRLRGKFNAKGKGYINTVWGVGYKFIPPNG